MSINPRDASGQNIATVCRCQRSKAISFSTASPLGQLLQCALPRAEFSADLCTTPAAAAADPPPPPPTPPEHSSSPPPPPHATFSLLFFFVFFFKKDLDLARGSRSEHVPLHRGQSGGELGHDMTQKERRRIEAVAERCHGKDSFFCYSNASSFHEICHVCRGARSFCRCCCCSTLL